MSQEIDGARMGETGSLLRIAMTGSDRLAALQGSHLRLMMLVDVVSALPILWDEPTAFRALPISRIRAGCAGACVRAVMQEEGAVSISTSSRITWNNSVAVKAEQGRG